MTAKRKAASARGRGRPARVRKDPGLVAAIAAVGLAGLAKALGVGLSAVSMWERVPPERALEVERITGVSRYVLRPDIYGSKPPRIITR